MSELWVSRFVCYYSRDAFLYRLYLLLNRTNLLLLRSHSIYLSYCIASEKFGKVYVVTSLFGNLSFFIA